MRQFPLSGASFVPRLPRRAACRYVSTDPAASRRGYRPRPVDGPWPTDRELLLATGRTERALVCSVPLVPLHAQRLLRPRPAYEPACPMRASPVVTRVQDSPLFFFLSCVPVLRCLLLAV